MKKIVVLALPLFTSTIDLLCTQNSKGITIYTDQSEREIIKLLQHQTDYLHRDHDIKKCLNKLLNKIQEASPEAHLIAADIAFNVPIAMKDSDIVDDFFSRVTGHFKDDFRFHSGNLDSEEFGLRLLINAYLTAKNNGQLDQYSLSIMTVFQKFLEKKKSSIEESITKTATYTAAGCTAGTLGALACINPALLCTAFGLMGINYEEPAPQGSNGRPVKKSFLIDGTSHLFKNKVTDYKQHTSRSVLVEISQNMDALTDNKFFKDNLDLLEAQQAQDNTVNSLLLKLYEGGIIVRSDDAKIKELKENKNK